MVGGVRTTPERFMKPSKIFIMSNKTLEEEDSEDVDRNECVELQLPEDKYGFSRIDTARRLWDEYGTLMRGEKS